MERLKNALLSLLLALFALALLRCPADAGAAARDALALALQTVLPSIFPFFVLSSLCVSSGAADALARVLAPVMRPLFHLSGTGALALALGLVGGYPVGARTAAQLHRTGALSRAEAERLLAFCCNAGPGFVLGVCGAAVLKNERAGILLYLVHVSAALLTGALLCRRSPAAPVAPPDVRRRGQVKSLVAAFPAAVRDSFAAAWSVCGYVVLFAVALRFVALVLPRHPLLLGAIEMTNGVLSLAPGQRGFVLCAVLLGWGGLSVHAQTLSVLEDSGISTRYYFPGKIMQAALSAPLAWLISFRLY